MEISLVSGLESAALARTAEEIDRLLRDVRPWLYRLALAVTARSDLAEDVAQEALLRISRSRHKLASLREPNAWMRTVTVRCALTAIAKSPALCPLPPPSTDPTDQVAVRHVLARLQPIERAILALTHFEGLSYAEIGEVLGIPVGTVASRLHAAREAFRKEWSR